MMKKCGVNRRQFVKYGAIGLAMLGGFTMVRSLFELQTAVRIMEDKVAGVSDDFITIVRLASLAPSGHNTQPWSVKMISPQHWVIGTVSTRWLPVIDPENREALISLGAFLENLIIAANSKGYHVESHIIAESPKAQDILEIKLYKTKPLNAPIQKIELRRTIREHLLNDALSKEDLDFLVGANKGNFYYFSNKSEEGAYLVQETVAANKIQIYHDPAQVELSEWIRWSNRDIANFRNGLTPESMEIGGVARWYVKNFYSQQDVVNVSFRQETIKRIKDQATKGSGWLLVTSKNSSVSELIETGRKIEHMWLNAREKKIAVHPMNQLIEETAMRSKLASTLGIVENIQFLIRIGYIENYPQPVSLRMPLEKILLL